MKPFSRALAQLGIASAVILSTLLIGAGVLLFWNPALVLRVLVYGIAIGCMIFGASILISLLAAVLRA